MKILSGSIALFLLVSAAAIAAEDSRTQTLKMKIEGMTCGFCVTKVQKQLAPLCREITIDREKGEGICLYGGPTTADQILSEANKTGFKTTRIPQIN